MPEPRPSTRVTLSAVAVAFSLLVPGGRRGERRWLRAPATAEAR